MEIHYWNLKDDKRKRPDWTIYIQNSMLALCCIVKVPDVSVLFRCDNPDTFPCPSKGDLECMWESDSAQFFNVAVAKQSKYSALHNPNMNKNTTTTIVMCELSYPFFFELNTLEHRPGFQIQCKCSNINHIAPVESNWMAPAATYTRDAQGLDAHGWHGRIGYQSCHLSHHCWTIGPIIGITLW